MVAGEPRPTPARRARAPAQEVPAPRLWVAAALGVRLRTQLAHPAPRTVAAHACLDAACHDVRVCESTHPRHATLVRRPPAQRARALRAALGREPARVAGSSGGRVGAGVCAGCQASRTARRPAGSAGGRRGRSTAGTARRQEGGSRRAIREPRRRCQPAKATPNDISTTCADPNQPLTHLRVRAEGLAANGAALFRVQALGHGLLQRLPLAARQQRRWCRHLASTCAGGGGCQLGARSVTGASRRTSPRRCAKDRPGRVSSGCSASHLRQRSPSSSDAFSAPQASHCHLCASDPPSGADGAAGAWPRRCPGPGARVAACAGELGWRGGGPPAARGRAAGGGWVAADAALRGTAVLDANSATDPGDDDERSGRPGPGSAELAAAPASADTGRCAGGRTAPPRAARSPCPTEAWHHGRRRASRGTTCSLCTYRGRSRWRERQLQPPREVVLQRNRVQQVPRPVRPRRTQH